MNSTKIFDWTVRILIRSNWRKDQLVRLLFKKYIGAHNVAVLPFAHKLCNSLSIGKNCSLFRDSLSSSRNVLLNVMHCKRNTDQNLSMPISSVVQLTSFLLVLKENNGFSTWVSFYFARVSYKKSGSRSSTWSVDGFSSHSTQRVSVSFYLLYCWYR